MPHIGFTSAESSFLVTDYYNGYSIDQIRGDSRLNKYSAASKKFSDFFPKLSEAFSNSRLTDFSAQNVLFVPSTGKFVLIDLRKM